MRLWFVILLSVIAISLGVITNAGNSIRDNKEPLIANPIPPKIIYGNLAVDVVDWLQLPTKPHIPTIIQMVVMPQPATLTVGSTKKKLVLVDRQGDAFLVEQEQSISPKLAKELFFTLSKAPFDNNGNCIGKRLEESARLGYDTQLLSIAFHPDFSTKSRAGYQKFYTARWLPVNCLRLKTKPFVSPSGTIDNYTLIEEWEVNADTRTTNYASRREVMVLAHEGLGRAIGHIAFNPTAKPQGNDYGNLYISVADGGFDHGLGKSGLDDQAQNLNTPFKKILRINPIAQADKPYGIPADNPFIQKRQALPEIWAYGLRNPVQFSWDRGGKHAMFIADIGEHNIEEINLGQPGANYGWSEREGRFVFDHEHVVTRLQALPKGDAKLNYSYPVVSYDHDEGMAVTGGYVYRGDNIPALEGQYIFGDLPLGRIFYADAENMTANKSTLPYELNFYSQGKKAALLSLISGQTRVELRFGQDEAGELYLFNSQDGKVRLLVAHAGKSDIAEQIHKGYAELWQVHADDLKTGSRAEFNITNEINNNELVATLIKASEMNVNGPYPYSSLGINFLNPLNLSDTKGITLHYALSGNLDVLIMQEGLEQGQEYRCHLPNTETYRKFTCQWTDFKQPFWAHDKQALNRTRITGLRFQSTISDATESVLKLRSVEFGEHQFNGYGIILK
jgi:hypothetical protein